MYISDLRIFHILMFLYLKFSNFEVKTSFGRSFIAFFYLKDRQNDIPKFHDRAVGDWELMTSTQELANCIFNFQCYFVLESFDLLLLKSPCLSLSVSVYVVE